MKWMVSCQKSSMLQLWYSRVRVFLCIASSNNSFQVVKVWQKMFLEAKFDVMTSFSTIKRHYDDYKKSLRQVGLKRWFGQKFPVDKIGRLIQLNQRMIFVRLWLTWKAKQSFLTGYVREESTNQIRQGATCRPIGFVGESSKYMSKRCQVPSSNACARVSNSRDGNTKEAFISPHFSTFSSVYERALRWSWGSETCRDIVFF